MRKIFNSTLYPGMTYSTKEDFYQNNLALDGQIMPFAIDASLALTSNEIAMNAFADKLDQIGALLDQIRIQLITILKDETYPGHGMVIHYLDTYLDMQEDDNACDMFECDTEIIPSYEESISKMNLIRFGIETESTDKLPFFILELGLDTPDTESRLIIYLNNQDEITEINYQLA